MEKLSRSTLAFLWVLLFSINAVVLSCRPSVDQRDRTVVPVTIFPAQPSLPPSPEFAGDPRRWSLPPSMPWREVAYLSNRTGLAEIWLLDLATGLERQLTATDCSDAPAGGYRPQWYQPGVDRFAWSPDGQRIAYLTKCTSVGHLAQLNAIDLETGSVVSITNYVESYSYPSWSPSGDAFIFEHDVVTTCDIYVTSIGEDNRLETERITDNSWDGCFHCPTWSPDGEYITYRGPYTGAAWRTYVSIVDWEGNHVSYGPEYQDEHQPRNALWIAEPNCGNLVWSHNGQYLSIASARGYVPGGLKIAEVEEQAATMYGGLISYDRESFGLDFYSPVFSPDDETLYFVSSWPDAEYGWPMGTVYSVQVRDLLLDSPSPDVQIVSPESQLAGFPALSQDGEWLLYAVKVGEAVEIWLQAVDGAYQQRLIGDGFVNIQPAWRPSSR